MPDAFITAALQQVTIESSALPLVSSLSTRGIGDDP